MLLLVNMFEAVGQPADAKGLPLRPWSRHRRAGWRHTPAALDAGDPDDAVRNCWVGKEKCRDVYLTDDEAVAA